MKGFDLAFEHARDQEEQGEEAEGGGRQTDKELEQGGETERAAILSLPKEVEGEKILEQQKEKQLGKESERADLEPPAHRIESALPSKLELQDALHSEKAPKDEIRDAEKKSLSKDSLRTRKQSKKGKQGIKSTKNAGETQSGSQKEKKQKGRESKKVSRARKAPVRGAERRRRNATTGSDPRLVRRRELMDFSEDWEVEFRTMEETKATLREKCVIC